MLRVNSLYIDTGISISQSHSNILCVGKCFTKTGFFSAARVNPPSTLEKCLEGLEEIIFRSSWLSASQWSLDVDIISKSSK